MDFRQLQSVSRAPGFPRSSCVLVVRVKTQKAGMDIDAL